METIHDIKNFLEEKKRERDVLSFAMADKKREVEKMEAELRRMDSVIMDTERLLELHDKLSVAIKTP